MLSAALYSVTNSFSYYQTHSDSCLKNDALDSTQGFKSHPLQGVLVDSSQQFLGLIARGWLKSKLPFQILSTATQSIL